MKNFIGCENMKKEKGVEQKNFDRDYKAYLRQSYGVRELKRNTESEILLL